MLNFLIVTILLFALILIGAPIAFSIGITSLIYILITNPSNITVAPLRMFAGVDSFILMAIPFFVLAAEIMIKSEISSKLFRFIKLLCGRVRGGLALVNVLVSTVFGSISGAALSDIAGSGAIEIEAMREDGYEHDFSCALTAASSMQSPLIPPSNIAVLYAGVMGLSVGALFMASVVPGLLIAVSQILYIIIMSKRKNFPKRVTKYTFKEVKDILKGGSVAMLMPVIILVGMLSGVFTPTEAAGFAVIYSLIVGLLVYRNISLKDLKDALWNTAKTSANLFMIIAFSSVFSWIMGMENVPEKIAQFMLGFSSNPFILLLITNIILVIVGMWMETGAAIILFAPILAPIMYKVGINPLHFAVVMMINLTIGLITPPVGVVLYAVSSVGKISFERVVKATMPFIVLGFAVVALVTYIPEICLFVPKLLGLL